MLDEIIIRQMTQADSDRWLSLASRLWPHSSLKELEWVFQNILHSDHETGVIVTSNDTPVAFMNLSLHFDYVHGALQRPVAYVEGLYVIEAYRRKGMARHLIKLAEDWAISRGCSQLASDALLDNVRSHSFHKSVGFREVARTVSFIKDIKRI